MVTELRDGVWWFEPMGVNAYLVADDEGLTLVDAGTPFDGGTVVEAIEAAGFDIADLERILITHYDFDHVGPLSTLAVDTPVYIGQADAPLLTGAERPSPYGIKRLTQLVSGPFVGDLPERRVRPLEDGDTVGGFTAHHAPGHTPGHTVYVHEERSAAFLGDLVIERDGELAPAPWFISRDRDRLEESIADLAARLPDFEVAAMGHGTPFRTGGSERLRALAERY
ncbi:beta-lactamase domain protein [Natronomonas pharaonis DSM 2160]|uniref:Beta-lactamase domain protein n=1 Tax=Natronomonas pharaonis (strain ATCC 35678 / DSM 2160 / CIP 103997 / JCM 8858 / NBRC 14720 / NCIMB 2260 / Gabara) TaxID=348780 RepID=A0A1U7EVM1_NATPD|nr:MBL fold metallo-hydrolase [Natronomonas pharaonis]CAI49078.2 beta-lactamase domain protein [Natronomonas pharaonis DSM 2160]